MVLSPAFEKKALRENLVGLTFEQFADKVTKLSWFAQGRTIWFVHGNILKEQAIQIATEGRALLYPNAAVANIYRDELPDIRCIALQNGTWLKMELLLQDKDNENSCLISYFEGGSYNAPS